MNELSTEVKAKETHENATIYYSRAEYNLYKHVMEVKKIRDERYYNELGYGTFDEYCQSEWNVKRDVMYQRIQIAERLSEDDFVDFNLQFGHNKTLLLTRMTESQREKALEKGIPTNEGYKPYDEATQQEINEYRRNAEEAEKRAIEAEQAKQQAESQAEQARRSEEIARKRLEELEEKEPQVIEKEIVKEVVPKRINQEIEQLKNMVKSSNEAYKQAERELQNYRLKEVNGFDEEQAEQELKKLRFEAEKGVLRLTVKVNKFLEEIAPYGYMEGEIATSSKSTKEQLEVSLEHLKNFIRRMETSLKGRIEI